MIWLRDLAVAVERAPDGRSARVLVHENDALPSGERPALEGAEVVVEGHREARRRACSRADRPVRRVCSASRPVRLDPPQIALVVRARGFNARHVRLDGTRLALDLREALYGRAAP